MTYYAHSTDRDDKSDWQPLTEHLSNVAELAAHFASRFNAGDWGRMAGLFHDAGKATKEFTHRLEGSAKRVDHATFGARLAQERTGRLGLLLSYIIAGHHGGLPNGGLQEGQLHHRLRHTKVAEDTRLLPGNDVRGDLRPPFLLTPEWAGYSLSLFTRMIFSCLVDADFLDTEKFCTPEKSVWRMPQQRHDLGILAEALKQYVAQKERNAEAGKVNALRKSIVAQCRIKAQSDQGIFSLTVPTGGGKTLSSLTFALEHAVRHNLSRVIYAIPFTSIIEQNAKVFREAIGSENVLEHHCNYKDDDSESQYDKWRSLAAENWDAPVIVTTNVQFFESLYSNKPSRCRKLHNIAGSVIILDEAQAIPTEYLEPCLTALRELVTHYQCTVVLCTATQPALDNASIIKNPLLDVREIMDTPQNLFAELKRVRVEFLGRLNATTLADRLIRHNQVLCIVSTKKQAQQVYLELHDNNGAFHLSTNMHPMHRLETLEKIRQHLKRGLSCRVIATSLVEAGVDLDFPVVYRAMAGLDSIAQAAGRCNREGRLQFGQVYVYEPEEMPAMPWLRRRISRARETLRSLPDTDCLGMEAIRSYFTLLFDAEDLDQHQIFDRLNPKKLQADLVFPFQDVADDFRLIADEGVGLIIPATNEIEQIVEQLRVGRFSRSTLRRLQQYSVSIRNSTLVQLVNAGAVEVINERYPTLRNLNAYDHLLGLREEIAETWEPELLIT